MSKLEQFICVVIWLMIIVVYSAGMYAAAAMWGWTLTWLAVLGTGVIAGLWLLYVDWKTRQPAKSIARDYTPTPPPF